MCDTCGCGDPEGEVRILKVGQRSPKDNVRTRGHEHTHEHIHEHEHSHGANHTTTIQIQQDVLGANNRLAARNRQFFSENNILALNLMSSPGSGKTTLLERTIRELPEIRWAVIEGDQQTTLDAERIDQAGADAVQVNTGTGCHLDAAMVEEALKQLALRPGAVLAMENVGNLVCPALFDLGESHRVVIVSTTEGTDKPLKYPTILRDTRLCVINKIDLLPYVDFDQETFMDNCRTINPAMQFIALSATTGQGFDRWYEWLELARESLPATK